MRVPSTLLLVAVWSSSALAAAPDPRAEALNEEGKSLYNERQDYAGAADKFRAAIAIVADARYYYNLCTALERCEQLDAALEACEEVWNHEPSAELGSKTGRRITEIRRLAKAKVPVPVPSQPPTTEPNQPEPNQPEPNQPEPSPSEPSEPTELEVPGPGYRWGLGVDLGYARLAAIGNGGAYNRNGVGFNVTGDLIVSPRLGLGARVDLRVEGFPRPNGVNRLGLSVVELGLGVGWHRRIWKGLHFAPTAGPHLSFMTVNDDSSSDVYLTVGLHAEVGFEWVFQGGMHVLAVTPLVFDLNLPALAQLGGTSTDANEYGLSSGSLGWAFTVGYRIRFKSVIPGLNLE